MTKKNTTATKKTTVLTFSGKKIQRVIGYQQGAGEFAICYGRKWILKEVHGYLYLDKELKA